MMGLVLLPVVALLLMWRLLLVRGAALGFPDLTGRAALVLAFGAFQVVLVLLTEGWSSGSHLTRTTVASSWALIVLVLAALLRRDLATGIRNLQDRMGHARRSLRGAGVDVGVAALVATAFGAVFALVGWLYKPANGDSMVYHLARVEHWVQNESVHPFATHYLAQVELGPLSSYNFAHLHILTGDDRLDGFVQLLATVVCVLGVSELARRLGLGVRGQAFAAVVCLTIPNLVLEATSTQNNNVAAAVGVVTVVVLTSPLRDAWARRGLAAGCAGGLVLLAKGTVVAMLGPACLVLLLVAVRRRLSGGLGPLVVRLSRAGAAAVLAAAVVAGPFVLRNVEMFDSPSGPVTRTTVSTDLTARSAAANVLRATAAEFAVGNGLFPKPVAHAVQSGLSSAFDRTGIDPADPRYFLGRDWDAFRDSYGPRAHRSEEVGANPFHTVAVVVVLAALLILALRRPRRFGLPFALGVSLCLGFLAFAASARWSIFAARYYTPLLVLWCPLIALAAREAVTRRAGRVTLRLLAALLVAACIPQLLGNATRPVIPMRAQSNATLAPYFLAKYLNDPTLKQRARLASYESAVDTVVRSGCTRVGIANWILLEYPLWAGFRLRDWPGTIQDVLVTNASRRHEDPDFRPCALLREATGAAATQNWGWAAFRYGTLAVSLAPTVWEKVPPPAGFAGSPNGTAAYPGAGWLLNPQFPSEDVGGFQSGAQLLLRATEPGLYDVRIEGVPDTLRRVRSPQAVQSSLRDGALVLTVRLAAGVNSVRLRAIPATDVAVTRVSVVQN